MKKKSTTLLLMLFLMTLFYIVPVHAASYKTISGVKAKYGSYYVWRPYNTQFLIQKVGSSKVIKITMDSSYTLGGAANGTNLYFTELGGKYDGKVTLYKYNLKKKKKSKIGIIKRALHIEGVYGKYVYGNTANSEGRSTGHIYRYNVKTKKKSIFLRNYWLSSANGRYLYLEKSSNSAHYRYDLKKKKLIKYNWEYD